VKSQKNDIYLRIIYYANRISADNFRHNDFATAAN